MKICALFFSLFLISIIGNAQPPGKTIQANTVDIKDGNAVIAKMVIIPGLKREIFLKSYEKQDSAGFYISEFKFSKPNHLEAKDFAVILQFNKTFENVYFNTDGYCDSLKTTIADNKLGASFQSSKLSADGVISVKIISKKPLLTTISGISGQL